MGIKPKFQVNSIIAPGRPTTKPNTNFQHIYKVLSNVSKRYRYTSPQKPDRQADIDKVSKTSASIHRSM